MPTTSNFGWTTPADTDLVKDGAAAIRTLGNGIDTSLVDLKGGTTGQVLSKNSNTDLDFTWVAQDDSNAIQNALLTTTGDTIYASAASTPARLGIGSTGQVLTVSGGVPSWETPSSGGMTLISTTTLTGASVTLSSIPQTYNHLQLVIRQYLPANASSLRCRINADTNTRYRFSFFGGTDLDGTTALTFNQDSIQIVAANNTSTSQSSAVIDFFDYTNTSTWKIGQSMAISTDSTTSTSQRLYANMFSYNQTGAISSLVFYQSSGNLTSGTLLLYGVK